MLDMQNIPMNKEGFIWGMENTNEEPIYPKFSLF